MKAFILIMFSFLFACAFEAMPAESSCEPKRNVRIAYYDNGQFVEKCKVYVYGCSGMCENSYSYDAHKENDYTSVERACDWRHQACKPQYSNAYATAELYDCTPKDTSQFDANNPWTVTIHNVTGCHCGQYTASSGENHCADGYSAIKAQIVG